MKQYSSQKCNTNLVFPNDDNKDFFFFFFLLQESYILLQAIYQFGIFERGMQYNSIYLTSGSHLLEHGSKLC